MGAQPGGKFHAFLGWVVNDQHAIHAGLGGIADEGAFSAARAMLDIVALDRVGITHQHYRRGLVPRPENTHHLQHLEQADTEAERLFASFLDDRAVSARVRKRHAEFDHVGAAGDHAVHEFGRDVGKRKARRDVGDQGLAAFSLEAGKGRLDAAHDWLPAPLAPLAPLASKASGEVATPPLTDRPRIEGRS